MSIGAMFRLSLYAYVVLVAATVARSEESWWPLVSLVLAPFAWRFTEGPKPKGLNEHWANFFGGVALMLSGFEFFQGGREDSKLLSGAHMLMYLSWIQLGQQKTERVYWALCVLTALQMAVGAVLTSNDPWFGVSAVLFCGLGTWTLTLLFMYRSEQQFISQFAGRSANEQESVSPSDVANGYGFEKPNELTANWINRDFILGYFGQLLTALVVGLAFFIFMPRVWLSDQMVLASLDAGPLPRPKSGSGASGFAESVRLGDLGTILESLDNVFHVQIYGEHDQGPLDLGQFSRFGTPEPLFRGKTLESYSNGQWNSFFDVIDRVQFDRLPGIKGNVTDTKINYLSQVFTLYGNSTPYLFSLGEIGDVQAKHGIPIGFTQANQTIRVDWNRAARSVKFPLSYSVVSCSKRVRQEFPATSDEFDISRRYLYVTERDSDSLIQYLPSCLSFDPVRLPETKRIADRIVREYQKRRTESALRSGSEPKPLTKTEIAFELERFLRDSGEYKYSLDLSVADRSIDPLEDFLLNRKLGHCEYFAAALAMMLRTQQIPSRVVSGFKGGEPNIPAKHLMVQNRHAHVWVEALLPNEQGLGGYYNWRQTKLAFPVYWQTLDATPAADRLDSIAAVPSKVDWFKWARFNAADLWNRYVVNVSLGQQQDEIYKPLFEVLAVPRFLAVNSVETLSEIVQDIWRSPGKLFSVTGGLVSFLAMLFVAGFVWIIRQLYHLFAKRWIPAFRSNRRKRMAFLYYDQFLRILTQCGFAIDPSLTPRETTTSVSERFGQVLKSHGIDQFPNLLCNLLYASRFGGRELNETEIDELRQGLNAFRSVMRR